MRSLLLQPRQAAWPHPRDSIGSAFGPLTKSGLFYWEARGPALDAYKQLVQKIGEILKEKQGPLPNSDIIWFDLFMIGPNMDNAKPHVMFAGPNEAARKKAKKIIKESGLLAAYPGMFAGEWAEAPHVGRQTLRVGPDMSFLPQDSTNFPSNDDSKASVPYPSYAYREHVSRRIDSQHNLPSAPSVVDFEQFITGSRRSTILNIRFGLETVRATSGLVWESEGAEYCLTAAHVFFRPSSQVDPESPQPNTDSPGFEFDGFPGIDMQANSPMGTSEGSLTAPPSEESDERNSACSTSPVFQEPEDSTRTSEDEVAEDQSMHPRARIADFSSQILFSASVSWSPDHHYMTSAQLDYILHKLPRHGDSEPAHGMQVLTSSVVIEPTEKGNKALVHTLHGILSGVIKKTGTYVLLPGSTEYQEVFVAYLDSPVEAGDSGAVVSNETDQVYGHIVSGSSTSAAFVMPLRQVYDEISRISQDFPQSKPSSNEQSHDETSSETFDPASLYVEPSYPEPYKMFSHGLSYTDPFYSYSLSHHLDEHSHGYSLSHHPDEHSYEEPSRADFWNEETTRLNAHVREFEGHTGLVRSTVISASANFMASASEDTTIRAWDISSGTLKQRFTGYTSGIWLMSISANGKFLAIAKETGSVQILSIETGSIKREITVDGRAGPVDSLAISSTGQFLAMRQNVKSETTMDERHRTTVSIWNVSEGIKEKDLLLEDTNAHTPMAISPNGKCVAALAPGSNWIWKWDDAGGEPELLKGHNDRINSLVISYDGIFIITASDDKTVRVWDIKTGTEQRVLEGHKCPVKLAAISKNSEFIISASEDGLVQIWDWRTGVVQRIVQRYGDHIQALAVSKEGRFVMSASEGRIVRLWDEEIVR